MATINSILNKIHKTELETHETKLALIDDFKNEAEKLGEYGRAFLKQRLVIYAEIKTGRTQLETYLNYSKKVISLKQNLIKKYNELGLDFEKDTNLHKALMHTGIVDEFEKYYQQIKSFDLAGIRMPK